MKKLFIIFLFCISILFANGQEFRVKDIQFIPLSIFHTNKTQDNLSTGGLHIGLDLGFKVFKQDIRLQLNTGTDANILGTSDNSFYSINILYEKSPNIFDWMQTDIYTGVGILHQSYIKNPSIPIENSYFNIPLGLRFIFFSENSVSLGLQFQSDFNYDNNTLIYSTVIRYNFKNNSKTPDQ